jgi:hypothetical protein
MLNGSSSNAWAQVDTGAAGWSLSTANPRTGAYHLRLTDGAGDAIVRRVFGAPLTEVLFGQALYFDQLPDREPIAGAAVNNGFFLAKFRTATNAEMVSIFLGTDGAISAYLGGYKTTGVGTDTFTATLLDRSLPVVGAGAYQHFEHYLKVGNGDGAYELRVDEVTVLNLTGIVTDLGGGEVSQVTVGRFLNSAFPSGHVDMADCYVNDTVDDGSACNWFIGDCKSGVRMVASDTAQADFALSAGASGFALLDEAPADDGSYISTAATTAESDFGIAPGPDNLTEILTARPFIRAMKDDAGTCTVAPNMKSTGVKGTVTDQPITTAFAYYDSNVPLDPATGVPWTPEGIGDSLEVIERIS